MTILEDLKTGRLVVAPREALADLCNAVMADISEAKRRLDADTPKDAPVHPVSAFLTGTALHIGKARATTDHTAGLIALVEGMEATSQGLARDAEFNGGAADSWKAEAEKQKERAEKFMWQVRDTCTRAEAAEARALAAEAERDALREALAPFGSGAVVFYENEPDDCVLSLGRWKYQEDGRARFYADVQFTVADFRRARQAIKEASE